jgi:NAD(P)-dependent dehydrogenase (short-subunit alcohol dehydrogenase family)
MNNILITGAASGIGKATAILFKRKGWQVGLLDVNAQALVELSAQLGGVWFRQVDVTDYAAVQDAVADFAILNHGRLRLLFNSSGILKMGHFEQLTPEQHQQTFAINVQGLINMTHAAFPFLRDTPRAQVLNMSSASALYGVPHLASYSASKFAVRGLTEALNLEWQPYDITVCDLMPPFVNTPMVTSQTFVAPVVNRLGVDLIAEDIALAAWQAMENPKVHNPVGLPFKALILLNKLTPSDMTRRLMGLLSRE